jgi:hypothetical protein
VTGASLPMWLATRQLRDRAKRHAGGGRVVTVRAREPADVAFLRAKTQVTDCLAIGLKSDAKRVQEAVKLARQLDAARILLPQSARALGFDALLTEQAYTDAARHLQDAFDRGLRDPDLIAGLLSALIRSGQTAQAAIVAAKARPLADGPAAQLAEVAAVIAWLDGLTVAGPPPADSGRLAELTEAGELIGEWLAYATGRILLIEGDAGAAADILTPLARGYPAQHAWAYYAATALALCDDGVKVAELLTARRGQPGGWAIEGVLADLRGAGEDQAPGTDEYEVVAKTRAALSGWTPLDVPSAPWNAGPGTHAENLEAYRTHLALLLARGDHPGLTEAKGHPAFARLPAADQMLWSGLSARPAAAGAMRALLARADELGHPRACLALAVLDLSNGSQGTADDLLTRAADRSPALAGLLRAWAQARAGRYEDAAALLLPLADGGDPRARYTLGSVRLLRVAQASAAGNHDEVRDHGAAAAAEFRAVLAAGPTRFDGEAAALLRAAELIATGSVSVGRPADATAPGSAGAWWLHPAESPWHQWMAAVTRLASGHGASDVTAIQSLHAALGLAEQPPPAPAVNAVAVLAARASLRSQEATEAEALHDMLNDLALRFGGRPGSRDLMGVALGMLLLTDRAESREAVAARWRTAPASERLSEGLRLAIRNLLRARPEVPEAPVLIGPTAAAARLLLAASERAADPRHWGEPLFALSRERDITAITDLTAALPALCAAAGSNASRAIPGQLAEAVQALVDGAPDGPGSLVAARCATAIRDYDSAFRLWVRVLGEHRGTLPGPLRDECARAQRYGATLAQQRRENLRAVSMLRLAARVADSDDAAAADRDRRLADVLELQACAQRLVTTLVPGTARPEDRPGRHRVLEAAIAGLPPLRRALLTGNGAGVVAAWTSYLRQHTAEIRLPHALAVLYREHALSSPDADEAEDWLARATTLWCLLACTEEFWHRAPNPGDRARLTEFIATELLERHASVGARAFKAGQWPTAAVHLRVLADCRGGRTALLRRIEADLKMAWPWGEGDDAQVSAVADRFFSAWYEAVLSEAERVRGDIADADLPKGISKNYEGAVALLYEFASLGVPVTRIARIALGWSNEWCRANVDANVDSCYRKNREIIQRAGKFADQLIAVSTRGESPRGENRALSNYFDWRAWLETDKAEKCRHLLEALRWNPANDHVAGILRALQKEIRRDLENDLVAKIPRPYNRAPKE